MAGWLCGSGERVLTACDLLLWVRDHRFAESVGVRHRHRYVRRDVLGVPRGDAPADEAAVVVGDEVEALDAEGGRDSNPSGK